MSHLRKSLLYDLVVVSVLVTVILLTDASVGELAVVFLFATICKSPYDAREARRRDRASGHGS